jgi:hypothetical protein
VEFYVSSTTSASQILKLLEVNFAFLWPEIAGTMEVKKHVLILYKCGFITKSRKIFYSNSCTKNKFSNRKLHIRKLTATNAGISSATGTDIILNGINL